MSPSRADMKLPKAKPRKNLIDPVLPLINVVFLLLIFVMMMSKVEGTDGYDVNPPHSTSEAPAGQRDSILVLTREGQVLVNEQVLDDADLHVYATQFKRDFPAESLKIKADKQVDATRLISLMEDLRKQGVDQLMLLTEKRN